MTFDLAAPDPSGAPLNSKHSLDRSLGLIGQGHNVTLLHADGRLQKIVNLLGLWSSPCMTNTLSKASLNF